jgi:biopolymer transport protein ExbB
MFTFIVKGGVMMYLLLVASVLVIAIIINRFLYFRKIRTDEDKLFTGIKDKLRSHGPQAAIAYAQKTVGPIANILKAGLHHYDRGVEKIEEAFEREALIEVPLLKKYLPALNTIGSISTLMGFTGTVLGMINAFNSIAGANTTSPAIVADGIAQALTTTAAGLIIAIPALIAYYYFSHQAETVMLDELAGDVTGPLSVNIFYDHFVVCPGTGHRREIA